MIQIRATLRSDDSTLPAYEADAFVPWADCPLAVTHAVLFDHTRKEWCEQPDWIVLHRPTGFHVGPYEWETREGAEAALLACDPNFPAWPLAIGETNDMATAACKVKFKAVEEP